MRLRLLRQPIRWAVCGAMPASIRLTSSATSASTRRPSPLSCRVPCTTSAADYYGTTETSPVIRSDKWGFGDFGRLAAEEPADRTWRQVLGGRDLHRRRAEATSSAAPWATASTTSTVARMSATSRSLRALCSTASTAPAATFELTKVWGVRAALPAQLVPELGNRRVRRLHPC